SSYCTSLQQRKRAGSTRPFCTGAARWTVGGFLESRVSSRQNGTAPDPSHDREGDSQEATLGRSRLGSGAVFQANRVHYKVIGEADEVHPASPNHAAHCKDR